MLLGIEFGGCWERTLMYFSINHCLIESVPKS